MQRHFPVAQTLQTAFVAESKSAGVKYHIATVFRSQAVQDFRFAVGVRGQLGHHFTCMTGCRFH